jgi:hypothetical protein
VKQVHFLHLLCLSLQLRIARPVARWVRERNGSRKNKEDDMRIIEAAAVGVVAIATQILVVATVLL